MKEKLQEYALIAEIISAIAIVLSLIFVGMQVRQGSEETAANTEALNSQVREAMLNADVALISWYMDHPDLIEFNFESSGKSKETIQRHTAYFYAFSRTRENYWKQHRNGILDAETYLSYRHTFLRLLTESDFYLELWQQSQSVLVPGFLAEINGELKKAGRLP
jgi:hypothetical protein